MANYLVHGLNLEQQEVLMNASIGLVEFDASTQSFLIDKEQFKRALAVLDCRIESVSPSQYEEIEVVSIRQKGVCMVYGLDDYLAPDLAEKVKGAILEVVVPHREVDVQVHFPNGKNYGPVDDAYFHIYIWSSLRSSTSTHPPEKLWGHEVNCDKWAYLPSGDGYVIEDSGYAVAEFYQDDHLYIHHNLFTKGSKAQLKIFRRILEEAMKFSALSEEEKLQYFARSKASERQVSRQNYIAATMQRFAGLANGARQYISSIRKEVPIKIQASVLASRREFLQSTELTREQLEAEFLAITSIDKVTRVQISDGCILVHTQMLQATNPRTGKLHDIGEFLIVVHLDGSHETVQWFNKTQRIDGVRQGMHAPRIYADGTACATELKEIFASLIANFEIAPVVQMAIEFVESADAQNELDKKLENWPRHRPADPTDPDKKESRAS